MMAISDVNTKWLSGFSGSEAMVVVMPKSAVFITDSRYIEQAQRELGDDYQYIKTAKSDSFRALEVVLRKNGIKRLGIEMNYISASQFKQIQHEMDVELISADSIFSRLRSIKSPEEIQIMREGAIMTEAAFRHILRFCRAGVTEYDLMAELIYFIHKQGADTSFPPIVASGTNSSMPHATVSFRKIMPGDFLTLDFGIYYGGLCTDFTRTIAISGVDSRAETVYNTVKLAQCSAIEAVSNGVSARYVDSVARNIITDAGFGSFYEHGTGHGVGSEIHEAPSISPRSEDILLSGMVVTVEPGIYLPGACGVRIEDMLIVKDDGIENFYTTDKSLIVI